MKIIFLGTPGFSVEPLKRIVEFTKHEVIAVVCNKDKPVGRKKILTPPPVKVYAQSQGIPVFQYDKIRIEGVKDMKDLCPDIMVTCAFGQILSKEILDIPKYGVINVHASLLPKYRGASPIHYAILNGDKKTGISIMKTDEGVDTGDVMFSKEISINDNETCGELFDRLSVLGADCLIDALDKIENGEDKYFPQNNDLASYTKIFKKEDALIDWSKSAEQIRNLVRAFNPAPVAFTYLNGEPFKIFDCQVVDKSGIPGEILNVNNEFIVACGKYSLLLKKVQKAGGKPLDSIHFLRGNKIQEGLILGK